MNVLEEKFESVLDMMDEKEQEFILRLREMGSNGYAMIKPILIAIATFWIFYRILNRVGIETTMFIQLTLIIVLLRQLLGKF